MRYIIAICILTTLLSFQIDFSKENKELDKLWKDFVMVIANKDFNNINEYISDAVKCLNCQENTKEEQEIMKRLREYSNYPDTLVKMLNIPRERFIIDDLYLIFNKDDMSQLIDTSSIFITSGNFRTIAGDIDSNYFEVHVPMMYKNIQGDHKYTYDFGFRKFDESFKLVSVYTTP